MSDASIIQSLGRPAEVARALGLPLTTVDSWKRANRIPNWRRPAIADLAKLKGVALPPNFLTPVMPAPPAVADIPAAPKPALTEGVVADGSRVVGERGAGVELDALEGGEEKQCLKKVHPQLPVPIDGLILDRELVRPTAGIKFDPAPQYMIRAIDHEIRADDELSVDTGHVGHDEFLSVGAGVPTVTEDGGAGNCSAAKAPADSWAGRTVQCSVCERRLSDTTIRACQAADCPQADRAAA